MSHDGDSAAHCACVRALDNRTTPVSAARVHVISRKDSERTAWDEGGCAATPYGWFANVLTERRARVSPKARGERCARRPRPGGGAPVAHSRLTGWLLVRCVNFIALLNTAVFILYICIELVIFISDTLYEWGFFRDVWNCLRHTSKQLKCWIPVNSWKTRYRESVFLVCGERRWEPGSGRAARGGGSVDGAARAGAGARPAAPLAKCRDPWAGRRCCPRRWVQLDSSRRCRRAPARCCAGAVLCVDAF